MTVRRRKGGWGVWSGTKRRFLSKSPKSKKAAEAQHRAVMQSKRKRGKKGCSR